MKTIVMSDLHGCYEEFKELLVAVNYVSSSDKLVVAGDLVDRGPESLKVVEWLRSMSMVTGGRVVVTRGNHDEKHVRYAAHAELHRIDSSHVNPVWLSDDKLKIQHALSPQDFEWLASLPSYVHLHGNWVVVHAGFEPGIPLEHQVADQMTHTRYLHPQTLRSVKMITRDNEFRPPAKSVFWTEAYDLPWNVIYGHMVHSLKMPKITRCPNGTVCYGIDTGACFGGALTALVFDDQEPETLPRIVQVQAKRTYGKLYHWKET